MIKIVAENYIKEEYQEEFLKLTKELIILSREEKGNISYHLYQDINDDSHFTFLRFGIYLPGRRRQADHGNLHVGEISQPDRESLFFLYQTVSSGDCPTGLETGINKRVMFLYFGSLYKMC